jgi:pilus assembly protein CpaE
VSVALRDLAERFVRTPETTHEDGADAKASGPTSTKTSRWSLSRGGNR